MKLNIQKNKHSDKCAGGSLRICGATHNRSFITGKHLGRVLRLCCSGPLIAGSGGDNSQLWTLGKPHWHGGVILCSGCATFTKCQSSVLTYIENVNKVKEPYNSTISLVSNLTSVEQLKSYLNLYGVVHGEKCHFLDKIYSILPRIQMTLISLEGRLHR